ncbi:MAG TPA: hypothetical protein VFO73_15580 [Candidatus Limnocylindrales bacterium]|nr:hypothetical protein [Candidatus Limnocylindrales bacterium]
MVADRPRVGLLTRIPLHPLLFAAYAVLFLYAENLDEVLPVDAAGPLAESVLAAAGASLVLALVFRGARRGAIVATAGVAAFFGFGHVSPALADAGLSDREQLSLWLLVLVAAAVYAVRAKGSLARVTGGLNLVAIVLVVMVGATILPYELGRARPDPVSLAATVTTPERSGRKPDIYFLVFDRYGSADSLERRFGLDNDMYGWLEDRGFHVPSDSHANYRATDFSLAATLNMQFLDNLTDEIGRESGDRTPAQAMIANHAVGRFLKGLGYRYYQIGSWFDATHTVPIADENLTPEDTNEFETVLNDMTILPAIDRVRGVVPAEPTFRDRHREGTLFGIRQLRRVATAPGPKFVFAHILLPHDPYVFRADGSPLPEAEADTGNERDLYAAHLAFANAQIKTVVDQLLAGPEDSRPIVIIEGDEGPLMCREVDCPRVTPDYLRIRLGNLIAMYLPGVDVDVSDTFTSVNTFRLVFREYFGADLELLPDRSFTWPDNDHIYDFRDVTDLILPPDG